MNNMNELLTIHPGEHLKDELEALGMSQNKLALELRIPAARVSEIINGKRGITADTAVRLGRFFNTSVELWLNLQSAYDTRIAIRKLTADGELEKIHPIKPTPARV